MSTISHTPHNLQRSTEDETQRDDLPFRPGQLYLSILFLPFVGIYILSTVNWRRLGHPQFVRRTLIYGALGLILAMAMPPLFVTVPLLGLGCLAYNALIGIYIVEWQRDYYDEWVESNGGAAPTFERQGGWAALLGVIVLALLANSVIYWIFIYAGTAAQGMR